MRITLAYGTSGLPLELPDRHVTVLEPRHAAPQADEAAALRAALRRPVGAPPLRELAGPRDRVAVAFSDGTRAQPRERVLPVLLDELAGAGVAPDRITLFNATGTHRANTADELAGMLGPVAGGPWRIVQHDCRDEAALADLGPLPDGRRALVNAEFLRADLKILTGFIEPHFFAGFTGGPKALMPGLAGLATVLGNHSAAMLDDPRATWGVTRGNPVWEEMSAVARLAGRTFLLDVALDRQRRITGVFAGDVAAAHAAGARFVAASALITVPAPFDIVVTSNAGFPLDRNLYQAVKGVSAAARVVKPGGSIVIAAQCRDGVPAGSGFAELLREADGPDAVLARVRAPGFARPDQWQAHALARVLRAADVHVRCDGVDADTLRDLHLVPCDSVEATLAALRAHHGPGATICVLPEGPLTIPTLDPAP